jgi:hypothetical protein
VLSRASKDRERVISSNEMEPGQQHQQQDAPQQDSLQQQQQQHQQQPLVWCQGIFTGTFVDEVSSWNLWFTNLLEEAADTATAGTVLSK